MQYPCRREINCVYSGKKNDCSNTDRSNVRKELRAQYAKNTLQLIASAQVVALEFQTIAKANNYWKNEK